MFVTINDDAWGGKDELWLYEMKVTWGANGSIEFNRTQQLSVESFDSNFGAFRDNIPQKGTTQKIDAVPNIIMNLAQYRNFDSYQAIVCCHTVNVDHAGHAGIRWYELRKTTGNWSIFQQGTYAPDANSRFMGSIAMNGKGDIAIGFSVSGSGKYPSIAYSGRRKSDPAGKMTIAEKYIWDGKNSQIGGNRSGDYTCLTVDPADDKTFWYTAEYANGAGKGWSTHIGYFSFGN